MNRFLKYIGVLNIVLILCVTILPNATFASEVNNTFETNTNTIYEMVETETQLETEVSTDAEPLIKSTEQPEEPSESDDTVSEKFNITSSMSIVLAYDDHYSFSSLADGYAIADITTTSVTSYVVANGCKTDIQDNSVLQLSDTNNTDVIASGVGTATVLLVPADKLSDAQMFLADTYTGTLKTIDAIQVQVTVDPGRLTLIFLAGQSNMEGSCSAATGYHPEDSVLCEAGQVYSTYAPCSNSSAANNTSIPHLTACTIANVNAFVPGSLTGSKALDGSSLVYPLDALTPSGKGKTGPDSGLAYEWHQLTGDKVWVVNAAIAGSLSTSWIQGETSYERAVAVYQATLKTFEAEIEAGHYTPGNRLLFWLQGESEGRRSLSAAAYLSNFDSTYKGLQKKLKIDYWGLISVRSTTGSFLTSDDVTMNGIRTAQYFMGNSTKYPNVYVVSNTNEKWISDSGVSAYFNSVYTNNQLTYPLRNNTTLSGLPKTVTAIHSDIHYSQVAHNENGITAAQGMYAVVQKTYMNVTPSISWRTLSNSSISNLETKIGTTLTLVPVVEPLYCSKQIYFKCASDNLIYNAEDGTLTAVGKGKTTLNALDAFGHIIATLPVTINNMDTPVLCDITNTTKGILITWNEVTGATRYRVYRKSGSDSWKAIADVTSTQYTDKNVKNTTSYSYTVRAYYDSIGSAYDRKGLSITCLLIPELTNITNKTNGVSIQWKAISGATKYRIYRKSGSGKWAQLKDTVSTSYVDKTAKKGTTYSYTVRAYFNKLTSSYDTAGLSITALSDPVLTSVKNGASGINLSWTTVTGAQKYRIYRKTGSGSWKKLADATKSSYSDTTVKSGTTYAYTIRTISGNSMSAYDNAGTVIQYLDCPSITQLSNTTNGVTLKWETVKGATKYRIYRKTDSGTWTQIADSSGTNYTDKTAQNGVRYTYTIRAYSRNASSHYDSIGLTIVRLTQPIINKISNIAGQKLTLMWIPNTTADGYQILYKNTSDSSTVVITGNSTINTTISGLTQGEKYMVYVRSYKTVSGIKYYSSWSLSQSIIIAK